MTWTENEFSNCIKSMRGSLSEINNFEKRSSSREDPSSPFNTNPEPKTYMQQMISRNNEPKLKHFGDLMKMQTGIHSTKNFLKRSQSSNAGSSAASDFRPTCFRSKNLDAITSQHDFSSGFEDLEIQDIDVKNASRGSYRDDAISTNSDSLPLLPLHTPSCHEAHENELFISCSPSSSSLISNKSVNVLANFDSLSICNDDEDVPARISIMNDSERRKAKSIVKSLYNIKTCSETDNKELNAAIQIAQNASSCLNSNKKPGQSRITSGKRSRWKVHQKEDRKTFSEDSRLHEDYHSTPNEQLTYNELISKPTPSYGNVFVQDVQRDRVNSLDYIRCRQHSSLSDSENLLNLTRDHAKEGLMTSRSDGTEVPLFEDKLKLFVHNCPEIIPACRHKSYPSGMGSSRASKQLAISQSVATSSRSLPTSLESNCRTFLLERQISTPLPNTSIALLSEPDESECGPPLPTKGGSRSNLSISDLRNQKDPKTVKPLFYHSHSSSIKDNTLSTTNQIQPEQLLSSMFSQEETANKFGAIQSEHLPSARNAVPMIEPASPPPLPSRTFFHCNTKSTKGPPLPPKGAVTQSILHRHPLPFQRPGSEESDNVEESSSSSESSNFASSIDSEGLEQYSENCVCKQIAGVDISKNALPPPFIHSNPGHSASQEDELLEKACAPMPGRYETSDSLVYDYFDSPPLDTCFRECHHITEKVSVLKKHFPEVSTNDLECALIENNYSIEEAIKHLTVKSALATSSRYNSSDMTSCIISRHRHHFVPDPMEA